MSCSVKFLLLKFDLYLVPLLLRHAYAHVPFASEVLPHVRKDQEALASEFSPLFGHTPKRDSLWPVVPKLCRSRALRPAYINQLDSLAGFSGVVVFDPLSLAGNNRSRAAHYKGRARLMHTGTYRNNKDKWAANRLPEGLSAVLAAEFVDPACRIDDLLLARVERMACRTNFNMQIVLDR